MRFLTMIRSDESQPAGPPPPELFEAIGRLGAEAAADGSLLDQGGLLPTAAGGTLIHVADGKVTVVDGPFTEAKEVVGGYAMYQLRSRDEAAEMGRRFMEIHAELWPGFVGTCEIRQLMEMPVPEEG